MSEEERKAADRLIKVDRYSKVAALFLSIGVFGISVYLTEHVLFNMSISAVAGIGIRFYIPYHATVLNAKGETAQVREFDGTGNYNHGAVGAGLLIGAAAALGVMTAVGVYATGMLAGLAAATASYLVLRVVLA
jgi:hypothetical protein